ncbi:hypothetical protein [Plastoroseomonas arctica]|uniref:Uncharacterized protein n=1 Tax=Plastoroseomonas arctica TaxID=1509237 RepID=A0AAF1K2V8_9PROT|nr:hypothetical protein [Plastoroseomonas arctica]MBR0655773.1 hypothetical protein [Plastoroseomonas arctica]
MAVSISDVLSIFSSIKDWMRLKPLPDRVDALERRLAALEARRSSSPDLLACSRCGMRTLVVSERPHPTFGGFGMKQLTVSCPSCLTQSTREFDPAKDPPLHR